MGGVVWGGVPYAKACADASVVGTMAFMRQACALLHAQRVEHALFRTGAAQATGRSPTAHWHVSGTQITDTEHGHSTQGCVA